MKAKSELEFELGPPAPFNIGKEMRITFNDSSQIKFYPMEKSKDSNKGAIIFDCPDLNSAERIGRDKVNRFFNCMLITKENFEQLTAPRFFPLTSPKGQTFSFTIKPRLTVPVEENELESAKKLMETIDTLSDPRKGIILRSLRWFRRGAEANSEDEDRFIYRWISFDLLLALLEKKGISTPSLIPEFINNYMKTETIKLILNTHESTITKLSEANLIGWRGAKRSNDLYKLLRIQSPDQKDILTKTMLCIYEVRNTLFHKGEALKTIINPSSALLRDVFIKSLETYVESIK